MHGFKQSIPSIFIATKPTWPDPEASIGRECSKISGLRCWEATGPALEIMNKLSVPIKEMLDKHQEILEQGELKPRAISFHMWMIGSAASAANPTIVFSSKSCRQRTFAKMLLKESKLLDGYPGIKIKTLDKAPAIYQAADFNVGLDCEEVSNDAIYMVDDSRGVCGSLVAFGNSRLATMGGVILIDNVHYGISAQHARFNYIRGQQRLASEPAEVPCFDDDSDSEYCDLIENTSRGSISSDSDYGSDTESLTSTNNLADSIFEPPYAPSSVDLLSLEIEEVVSTPQDRRLCGQKIADISANYIQTDLDYEIFRLDDPRFHSVNNISLPAMQDSAQMLRPGKPARMPVDAAVWVVTGTTGSVRGTMTSMAHFIKMEGSRTFQEMWAVRLDRETRPGDCGAWVIDAFTGSIYGHVIAGDLSSSMAYVIPAYKVFDDIESRFGVRPLLPSEPAVNPIKKCIIASSESTRNCTIAPWSSTAAPNSALNFFQSHVPSIKRSLPLTHSLPQDNRVARPRVDFFGSKSWKTTLASSRFKALRTGLCLEFRPVSDASNRKACYNLLQVAPTRQRTRCQRSGTSRPQILTLNEYEPLSNNVQSPRPLSPRYPLAAERRTIRILALAPGTVDEPLRGDMIVHSLDHNDFYYTALSYHWSKLGKKGTVTSGGALLDITGNLEPALYHLRKSTHLKDPWVDKICINRRDFAGTQAQVDEICTNRRVFAEKHAQVSFMVYVDAHRRLVLLVAIYAYNDLTINHICCRRNKRAECGISFGNFQDHAAALGINYSFHHRPRELRLLEADLCARFDYSVWGRRSSINQHGFFSSLFSTNNGLERLIQDPGHTWNTLSLHATPSPSPHGLKGAFTPLSCVPTSISRAHTIFYRIESAGRISEWMTSMTEPLSLGPRAPHDWKPPASTEGHELLVFHVLVVIGHCVEYQVLWPTYRPPQFDSRRNSRGLVRARAVDFEGWHEVERKER